MRPKVKQFKDAKERYGGNVSKVAEAFKVNRTIVYSWIRTVPEFKQILDDARMRLFDECLSTARITANGIPIVENGRMTGWAERPNSNMLRYLLSTLGRNEGFGEVVSIETQIKTEYAQLEKLLAEAPDEAIEKIAEKVAILNRESKGLNEQSEQ